MIRKFLHQSLRASLSSGKPNAGAKDATARRSTSKNRPATEVLEDRIAPAFAAVLELSALTDSNGFQINGEAAGDNSGYSVSAAGDINGDGVDDLIIGAYRANSNGADSGVSYVVFGSTAGSFGSNLELSALNGSNGFQINGEAASDYSGVSVSAAGDINGDGVDDLIIGAYGADPNGGYSGASYVVFGSSTGSFGSNFELSALNGSNGFRISGEAPDDLSGRSVSAAGDINGDDVDDLIIGALVDDPNGGNSGASYVVFGSSTGGFGANLQLSALNGSNGFKINGEAGGDYSGFSAAAAGDINGDGVDDLTIGAFRADPNGTNSGASYVVFGSSTGSFGSSLELSALNGSNGFQITGEAAGDNSGRSVSAAGDINGDGVDDLIIGAYRASANGSYSGASYVVFGSSSGSFGSNLDLSALDGSNGFQISGEAAGDNSGVSVSAAGDINGDGVDDLIIGAVGAEPNGGNSGASYVVFGSTASFGSNLDLSTLDGSNGFQIRGEAAGDYSGISVSEAGDINGDGVDDLIIGAFRADPNGSASGASYVVFGQATPVGTISASILGGVLTVTDDDGTLNNDLTAVIVGTDLVITDANEQFSSAPGGGALSNGNKTLTIPLASLPNGLVINGAGGNDMLLFNPSGGILPLTFNGGAGGDDGLTIGSGTTTSVTHTANNANDGSITFTGSLSGAITYTGLEPITDNVNAADRVFTFTGGTETITLADGAGATMTIDSDLAESVNFPNPTNSLTINAGTGNDTVTITSVDAAFNASLTINGDMGNDTININADLTLASGNNLDLNLLNDATAGDVDQVNFGVGANVTLSGAGTANVSVSRDITFGSGSSISTTAGTLTLSANAAGGTTGDFIGLNITGTTISTTTGALSITGRGGTGASNQRGVNIGVSGVVTTTSGNIEIVGISGSGALPNSAGVFMAGAGGSMSSTSGNIRFTADSFAIGSSITVATGAGSEVAFRPFSSNFAINLGGTDSNVQLGLTDAELDQISAGTITIGDLVNTGALSATGAISRTAATNIVLTTASNAGLTFSGGSTTINANGGDITVTLTGASSSVTSGTAPADLVGDDIVLSAGSGGIGASGNPFSVEGVTLVTNTSASNGPQFLRELSSVTIGSNDLNAGSATITLQGDGLFLTTATGSVLSPLTVANGGSFGGTGAATQTVNVTAGGTITPATGVTTGTLSTGSITFATNAIFDVQVNGATAGNFDQLNVTGTVNLANATLQPTGTIPSVPGQTIIIIANDGADAITGTFNGLPEGSLVTINSRSFRITYAGGTGNDVALIEVDTYVSLVSGNLTITDVSGGTSADNITVVLNGANVRISDPGNIIGAGPGVTQIDPNTVEVPFASVTGSMLFDLLAGTDSLNLNLTAGDIVPAGGVTYTAGANGGTDDSLTITGGVQGAVTYNYTNANDGSIVMANFGTVTYTGLEPILNTGTATDVVFNLPSTASSALLADNGTGGDGLSRLSSTNFPDTTFNNPTTSATLTRGNASSTLTINALPDYTASLTAGAVGTPFSTVTVGGTVSLTGTFSSFSSGLTSINGSVTTADQAISIRSTAGSVALGASVNSGTAATTITASTAITRSAGNITGSTVTLTTTGANGSIGASGAAVQTAAGTLSFTSTGTGNVFITEADAVNLSGTTGAGNTTVEITSTAGSIALGLLDASASSSTVTLTAAGAITDNNAASNNLDALNAVLSASAVGVGDILESTLSALEASTTGDFNLSDSGTLTIGGIGAFNGISTTSGAIQLFTTGAGAHLTIQENIAAGSSSNILLDINGSITETTGSISTGGTLTTDSIGGQTLTGANTVANFTASNVTSGVISLTNTAATLTIVAPGVSNPTRAITINNTGDTDVDATITSAGATGGDITVISSGQLTVNALVTSAGGSGGTLTIANSVIINASPVLGAGDITLQGASGTLVINSPIVVPSPLTLTSTEDIEVNALVQTTLTTSDLTLIADSDSNGVGGIHVSNGGSLNGGNNLSLSGSDYSVSLGDLDSIVIDADGTNTQVQAGGDLTFQNNTLAPTGAAIFLGGRVLARDGGNILFVNNVVLSDSEAVVSATDFGIINFFGGIDADAQRDLTLTSEAGHIFFFGPIGQDPDTLGLQAPNDILVTSAFSVSFYDDTTANSITITTDELGTTNIFDGAPVTLTGSGQTLGILSGTLNIFDDVDAGGGNVLFEVDNIDLGDSDAGTVASADATLTIRPRTLSRSIGINEGGDLNLTTAEVANIVDGFADIFIGRTGGTGAVNVGEITFEDTTHFIQTGAGATMTVTGTITGSSAVGDDVAFDFQVPSLVFNAPAVPTVITDGGGITIGSPTLGVAVRLDADTTFSTVATADGDVFIRGTVNGASAFEIVAGNDATVTIQGVANSPGGASVGGGIALDSITITGGTLDITPQLVSTGDQAYNADDVINLRGTTTLRSTQAGNILINGPLVVFQTGDIITQGDITFADTVDAFAANAGVLRVTGGVSSNVQFQGAVGTTQELLRLEVNTADVTTFVGSVVVDTLLRVNSNEIDFNGGPGSVSATGEAPQVILQSAIAALATIVGGGANSPGSLSITETDLAAMDASVGDLIIGRADNTGGMTVEAENFTVNTTFRQSGRGTSIAIDGPLTGSPGVSLRFEADFIDLDENITTDEGDIVLGDVRLLTDVVLATGDGDVLLTGGLNGSGSTGNDLIINAGSGSVEFKSYIGTSGLALGTLEINSTGVTKFGNTVKVEGITTDGGASGWTEFYGAYLRTAGLTGINIGEPLLLNSGTQLIAAGGGNLNLDGGITSKATKAYNITLQALGDSLNPAGDIAVGGNIGDANLLVSVGGPAAQGGIGSVTVKTAGTFTSSGAINASAGITIATGGVDLGAVQTLPTKNVTITTSNIGLPATFGGAISGNVIAITTPGDLTITTLVTSVGKSTFTSRLGDVVVSNVANSFGQVGIVGVNGTLVEGNDTLLQTVNLKGDFALTSTGNVTQALTAKVIGDFTATVTGTLSLTKLSVTGEFTNVTASTVLLVQNGFNFRLAGGATITSTAGDVTLVATGTTGMLAKNFINNGGSIAAAGNFFIYSYSKAATVLGSIVEDNEEIGVTYPTAPSETGNVVLYRILF